MRRSHIRRHNTGRDLITRRDKACTTSRANPIPINNPVPMATRSQNVDIATAHFQDPLFVQGAGEIIKLIPFKGQLSRKGSYQDNPIDLMHVLAAT
jgi:hypothetical protein